MAPSMPTVGRSTKAPAPATAAFLAAHGLKVSFWTGYSIEEAVLEEGAPAERVRASNARWGRLASGFAGARGTGRSPTSGGSSQNRTENLTRTRAPSTEN